MRVFSIFGCKPLQNAQVCKRVYETKNLAKNSQYIAWNTSRCQGLPGEAGMSTYVNLCLIFAEYLTNRITIFALDFGIFSNKCQYLSNMFLIWFQYLYIVYLTLPNIHIRPTFAPQFDFFVNICPNKLFLIFAFCT